MVEYLIILAHMKVTSGQNLHVSEPARRLRAIVSLQNVFHDEVNTGKLLFRFEDVMPMEYIDYKVVDVEGTTDHIRGRTL